MWRSSGLCAEHSSTVLKPLNEIVAEEKSPTVYHNKHEADADFSSLSERFHLMACGDCAQSPKRVPTQTFTHFSIYSGCFSELVLVIRPLLADLVESFHLFAKMSLRSIKLKLAVSVLRPSSPPKVQGVQERNLVETAAGHQETLFSSLRQRRRRKDEERDDKVEFIPL